MAREDVQTNIRLPEDLKESLTAAAAKNGRSLTAEIVQRLEHSFTPWEERPWEERMVVDINRAMIKLLTDQERGLLLDRVKAAGGADAVNGYAPTLVRTVNDLRPPVPAGPRLIDSIDRAPDAGQQEDVATALALKVLEVFGNAKERAIARSFRSQPASEDVDQVPGSDMHSATSDKTVLVEGLAAEPALKPIPPASPDTYKPVKGSKRIPRSHKSK